MRGFIGISLAFRSYQALYEKERIYGFVEPAYTGLAKIDKKISWHSV